jgi:hypothetical protein
MLRKISFVAFSLLAGCVTPPAKPLVSPCLLDIPDGEAFCAPISDVDKGAWEPIGGLDRATAFKPKDWEKVQNYIDAMENYVKTQCKR